MQSTKLHVLETLKRRRHATVDELAAELDLARATVRHHLDSLQRDGAVTYVEVRRETGRPHHLYSVTEHGEDLFPKSYVRLTNLVLHEIASLTAREVAGLDGRGVMQIVFGRLADQLYESHADRLLGKSYAERAAEVVRILNDEGFLSQGEATDEGFRIVEFSCPYLRAAESHTAVCNLDLAFIQRAMPGSVERSERLAGGAPACTYLLREQRNDLNPPAGIAR